MGILSRNIFKNQANVIGDPDFLRGIIGGMPARSGAAVNESTSLKVTAYLACVKIISETVASLPLLMYRKDRNGSRARAPDHSLYSILHDIGNEEMTAYVLRETIQGHAANWGNGYAHIERNGFGDIIGLWPLLPDRTRVERNRETRKLQYRTRINGDPYILKFEDVLHIPGFGFDGLMGYNPVLLAKEAIGLALATEEFGARFFGDGANPSGIIEYPNKLKKEGVDAFREDAKANYAGLGKSHHLMVLEEGLKFHQTTIPPEVAQFLLTRTFQIQEMARIFRVPLHMLAELSKATFSNIEHQGIEFVVHTLRPWLIRWEQAIKMKLISPADRKRGFYAEHLVDGLLRGDIASRSTALATQRQNGIISADEWRAIENMNPLENKDEGEAYLVNGSMISIKRAIEGGEQPNAANGQTVLES